MIPFGKLPVATMSMAALILAKRGRIRHGRTLLFFKMMPSMCYGKNRNIDKELSDND